MAATAKGTPMEWLPPRTMETVGLVIPAISSAMARPASTSPPTVLRRNSTPSTSSDSSSLASMGRTCSYLVVLAEFPAVVWPSIWPMMVRQYTLPWGVRVMAEPKSKMDWVVSLPPSFSFSGSVGLVFSVIVSLSFPGIVSIFMKTTRGPGFHFSPSHVILVYYF